MPPKRLAVILREARQRQAMNQVELGKKARVTTAYISLLESGKKTNPSVAVLHRIADALDIPASELLTDERPLTRRQKYRGMVEAMRAAQRFEEALDRALRDGRPAGEVLVPVFNIPLASATRAQLRQLSELYRWINKLLKIRIQTFEAFAKSTKGRR